MYNSNNRFRLLVGLSLLILLMTLFFGLRGKGFHLSNGVAWIVDESGIRFGNYGIAYGLIDNNQIKNDIYKLKDFSIEIAIKPEDFDTKRFCLILTIHDGKDSDQLIVGQWQSHIIAMNGDDYSNRRKIKRISTDISSDTPRNVLLTITTGDEGTRLYINGKLVQAKSDLCLNIPTGDFLRITLGNSVYGKHSWRGEVYGLALYQDRLSPETIETRFNAWSENQVFPLASDKGAVLFFPFNERQGTEAIDYVSGIQKLDIPGRFHILEKRFISLPWWDFQLDKSLISDFIINLLGFIPLGFILSALFIEYGGIFQKKAILFSVLLCFSISLGIEMAQAWIPSRSSQALDLALNTVGAFFGAGIGQSTWRIEKRLLGLRLIG